MALSSIFVVSNSLLLQLHGSFHNTEKRQGDVSSRLN
jgi:P-type Cu+ transporter